jgi:hypothetical protein
MKNDKKKTPKYVGYVENLLQETKWYDPGKVKFGFWCKMCNYPVLRQPKLVETMLNHKQMQQDLTVDKRDIAPIAPLSLIPSWFDPISLFGYW